MGGILSGAKQNDFGDRLFCIVFEKFYFDLNCTKSGFFLSYKITQKPLLMLSLVLLTLGTFVVLRQAALQRLPRAKVDMTLPAQTK